MSVSAVEVGSGSESKWMSLEGPGGHTLQLCTVWEGKESCPDSDVFPTRAVLGNHLLSCDFAHGSHPLVLFHPPRHQHMLARPPSLGVETNI